MCWDFCSPSSPGPLVGFWADSSKITCSPPDLLEGTEDLPAPDSEELGGLQWSRLSLPDREDQDGNDGFNMLKATLMIPYHLKCYFKKMFGHSRSYAK